MRKNLTKWIVGIFSALVLVALAAASEGDNLNDILDNLDLLENYERLVSDKSLDLPPDVAAPAPSKPVVKKPVRLPYGNYGSEFNPGAPGAAPTKAISPPPAPPPPPPPPPSLQEPRQEKKDEKIDTKKEVKT